MCDLITKVKPIQKVGGKTTNLIVPVKIKWKISDNPTWISLIVFQFKAIRHATRCRVPFDFFYIVTVSTYMKCESTNGRWRSVNNINTRHARAGIRRRKKVKAGEKIKKKSGKGGEKIKEIF